MIDTEAGYVGIVEVLAYRTMKMGKPLVIVNLVG